ncbi:MAG: ferredoxin--NADP reductase [Bdellovibrionales bacterium]|nr:ferredoxin--NADP reductase [Bdellovibrionales bacterium]
MSDLISKITTPLKIKRKIQETSDTYSFTFEIPLHEKEKFLYSAGQFVTLFMNINGESISRSYSLASTPALNEDFQITVKRVPGGKGSNFLADSLHEGDTVLVMPPQGRFFQPYSKENHVFYFLFAAGSGITPIYSICKELLAQHSNAQIYFFYANRDENNVIFKSSIEKLASEHSPRLHLTYMYSKPKAARLTLVGRCSSFMAKNFALQNMENADKKQAYICGPEGFMAEVKSGLQSAGFTDEEIRMESYGPSTKPKTEASTQTSGLNLDDKIIVGDDTPFATPKKIQAIINGTTVEVDALPETSILESLIEAGQNPPYSCMNGACMACMAKITKGRIYQNDPGILTHENLQAKEILTCQAKPLTETVVIDYDNF